MSSDRESGQPSSSRRKRGGARPPDPHLKASSISGSVSSLPSHFSLLSEEAPQGSSRKEAMCIRSTFFVNVDWRMGSTLATATNIVGQMYVECLEPADRIHPYPIVLIHGDFHTGQTTKPDGQPGWASYFLNQGFQVYIVDLPPSGRSNFLTSAHFIHRDIGQNSHSITAAFVESELTAPEKLSCDNPQPKHDRALLHDKWPGTGQRGDPIFAKYCASLTTLHLNKIERQSLAQNALQALLQHVGKSVLISEGTGSNMAWLATDVEPGLVAGVIAVEPAGPPFGTAKPRLGNPNRTYTQFIQRDKNNRIYGLTDIPLTYDPPTHPHEGFDQPAREPLDIERILRPDQLGACFMQKRLEGSESTTSPEDRAAELVAPAGSVRQLTNLKKVPQAVVTAHASSHMQYDWATASFMIQAGVDVDWIRLEEQKILGNGHLMFLETNSDQIARVLVNWIARKTVPETFCLIRQDPLTPPEPRAVSISDNQSSSNVRSVQPRPHSINSSGSQATDEDPAASQPVSTPQLPTKRTSKQSQGKSSEHEDSVNANNKRPAAPSSGQTTVGAESQSSSDYSGTGWGQSQKRPRIQALAASSPSPAPSPHLPQSTPDLPQPSPSLPHQRAPTAQMVAPSQDRNPSSEQPIPDLAMMRPSHPGGGPLQLRQQPNSNTGAPMPSPSLGHNIAFPHPKPFPNRPSNLYEHLPIGAKYNTMVRDTDNHPGFGPPRTVARFEHRSGTAEASIASIACNNQARVAYNYPPVAVAQQLYSPIQNPQNLRRPSLNQAPKANQRGQRQKQQPSTPIGEIIQSSGNRGPRTPSVPPSTLESQQTTYDGVSNMTPPTPSPAPRVSSDAVSSNASVASPAVPKPGQKRASK
ncbi:hypothetical protein FDECE_4688 [Fusarium decemcellulare]|nr:hypothetical protein FDECE_4688 [Fusarium decemcellulare]